MKTSYVGQSLPAVNAREKVLGTAVFVADVQLPQMLHGKVLRSPYPHARIVHIDIDRARRIPGVRAIVTGADTPHAAGIFVKDEHVLAVDRVRFVGEEVAAVAAVDESTALEAVEAIRVEYEELPAVFTPEEALRPGAPELHAGTKNVALELRVERGDVDAGFREAAVIHEETYETSYQYHAFTEPMGTVASVDASGRLTVWAPTQSIYFTRHLLAGALGMSVSQIRVIQTYIGGGFGGKLSDDRNTFVAAALALKARRPVRLINTRTEDFLGNRPRVPARIRLKMGASGEGVITAKEAEILADNGAYTAFAGEVTHMIARRLDSLYRLTNLRTHGVLVYTNKVPTGAMRGFGTPQIAFALDSHVDALAEKLGMDSLEFRLRNAIRKGDTSIHGWYMGSCGLTDCLKQAAERIGWSRRAHGRAKGTVRRGIGIGSALHVSGNRQLLPWDGSTVAIKVNEDGKVNLICGEADMGQGLATILTQIVADVLGIRPENVTVTMPDSDVSPYCFGAWGSRATMLAGNATIRAARGARDALLSIAAEKLEVSPADLTIDDGVIHVVGAPNKHVTVAEASHAHIFRRDGEGIFVKATFDPDTVQPDAKYYGDVSAGYSFGAQAAEVEVNTETGVVRVVRLVAADDVGRAINPMQVEGQIHGAVVQAMGWALFEELAIENGRMTNGNLADYTVPTANSIPQIDTVLVETQDPNGPFGGKGASECPFSPTAGAIANAVYDAIGVRITSLPITPEKVLRALERKVHA
jgi:4-hydroxybenzoyl-CoA reductase alpha subunit